METSSVAERVKRVIAGELGVEADRVTPEAKLVDDLGADSLDVVEMTMGLEEEFGIVIEDEAWEDLETVGQAIELVEGKVG